MQHEGTAERPESRSAPGSTARLRAAGSSTPGRRSRSKARCTSFRTAAGPQRTVSRAALLQGYGDPRLDVRDVAIQARNGDRRARRVFYDELASALGEIAASSRSFGASCHPSAARSRRREASLGRDCAALAGVDGLQEIVPAERVSTTPRCSAAARRYGRDGRPPRGPRVGAWQ